MSGPKRLKVSVLRGLVALGALALGVLALCALALLGVGDAAPPEPPEPRDVQNARLIEDITRVHGLDGAQRGRLEALFAASSRLGQGNPAVTAHPMSPAQCAARQAEAGVSFEDPEFERICGGPNMAPLFDPATQGPHDALVCIDRLEFPDIPCAYPVVWARASEAAEVCAAVGKRICDAHEWEGACAGALTPPDYPFELVAGQSQSGAVGRMARAHNAADKPTASWSYGPAYREGVCGTGSAKSPGCDGGGWTGCGSNTYPTGAFPECHSSLGVYDLNGNAAEHMNLPLSSAQLASAHSGALGVTEMKGSWFIFDTYRAHEDWCRWRAPFWHGTTVEDPESHRNYHLSFRCCKDLAAAQEATPGPAVPR